MRDSLRNLVEGDFTIAALERMGRGWSTSWRIVNANVTGCFCTKTFNINWYRTVWEGETANWITNRYPFFIVDEEDRKFVGRLVITINSNVSAAWYNSLHVRKDGLSSSSYCTINIVLKLYVALLNSFQNLCGHGYFVFNLWNLDAIVSRFKSSEREKKF